MNLKTMAMNKSSSYRTKQVTVAEWDDLVVTIREPMHVHFNRYARTIQKSNENEDLSETEKDNLAIKAEVKLFLTILLNENGDPVFNEDDLDDLMNSYGPVHTRLLNSAVELVGLGTKPIEGAEKK